MDKRRYRTVFFYILFSGFLILLFKLTGPLESSLSQRKIDTVAEGVVLEGVTANHPVEVLTLEKKGISAIFVFANMCVGCNKNLPIWERIARIEGVKAKGVLMISSKTYQPTYEGSFKLVMPEDIEKFKRTFNIRSGVDYTILLDGQKVVYSQFGIIGANEYFTIKYFLEKRGKKNVS